MRLSRADIRRRINADLELRYDRDGLTSYAGLELVRQFVDRSRWRETFRRTARRLLPASDFGAGSMTMLVLTLLLCGARRVRHVDYLQGDPVVARMSGLSKLPTARTLSRWLSAFDATGVNALLGLNEGLVSEGIRRLGLRRLTIDVDGTVVSTGLQVENARRGYNPHRRKVPSYYPITAYEANSGQLLRVRNRAGNVHDGCASLGFLREVFAQVDSTLADTRAVVEMRMDSAFFRADVLELLTQRHVEYAIKVPFHPWLKLKEKVSRRRTWAPVDASVECFEIRKRIHPWSRTERIVVYRKRVHHKSAKNFQLDLFDPDDGYYEYSAIVTNKSVTGRTLWFFMCGRGSHEKAYAELKDGFAFDSVASRDFEANSAWQVLSVLAFNINRAFQSHTTAVARTSDRKRRTVNRFQHIRSLRYQLINRAGLLTRPCGRRILDVGSNPVVRGRFDTVCRALASAC